MTTLYLARHGETVDNVARIMQGQRQGQLTSAGRNQMERLADTLCSVVFDAVVSSDLWRAYTSAQIVAARFALTVRTTELLRERDWGDLTGVHIPDGLSLGEDGDKSLPDNVEKMGALLCRAACFLDWVRNNYPDKTVFAVGHGDINRAVQAVHGGVPASEIPLMPNAGYAVLNLTT